MGMNHNREKREIISCNCSACLLHRNTIIGKYTKYKKLRNSEKIQMLGSLGLPQKVKVWKPFKEIAAERLRLIKDSSD